MFQDSPSYLIYVSLAVGRMSAEQLIEVSVKIARRYDQYQVTGVSLYAESRFITKLEGRFLHLLEGSEESLQTVYEMCLKGNWEHGLMTVARGSCAERLYSTWSLTSLCTPALHAYGPGTMFGLNSNQVMSWNQGSSDHRLVMLNHFCQLNGWSADLNLEVIRYDACKECVSDSYSSEHL